MVKDSAAQELAQSLIQNGVDRNKIVGDDILSLYASLGRSANSGNLAGKSTLPDLPKALPNDAPISAVIVETRLHPALEFVVCQVART